MFTRCRFQNVPIRVPFSKSTVFKICRQIMCRFRVNRRPIRHIFCRFQNVPASCERSLSIDIRKGKKERNLFPNKLATTVFFPPTLHLYLSKHTKRHIKMLLIYQATFLDTFLLECFTKTQQISLLKLM